MREFNASYCVEYRLAVEAQHMATNSGAAASVYPVEVPEYLNTSVADPWSSLVVVVAADSQTETTVVAANDKKTNQNDRFHPLPTHILLLNSLKKIPPKHPPLLWDYTAPGPNGAPTRHLLAYSSQHLLYVYDQ